MNKKNKKGFTLVELLAVIVVLIIIMLVAITFIRTYTKRSKEKALTANALSYVKAIDDKSGLDVLENKIFKNGVFNLYALNNYAVKVAGTSPDDAMVCVHDYKVTKACLTYGKYKVEYENDDVKSISKGKCKSETFSCELQPLKAYEWTGNYQEFVAPHDGEYRIDLWGAQGGSSDDAEGGKGAYTSGTLYLNKGEKLYIYVGGKGSSRTYAEGAGTVAGGYNGGASGNVSRTDYTQKNSGGGGATDVRLVSGTWNNAASLRSRIMVAAGGGGIYSATDGGVQVPAAGGVGGALTGGAGYYVSANRGYSTITPTGGTQTSGGQSVNDWNRTWYESTYIGTFGSGATGAYSYGGGGGGYWGGASGVWKPGAGGSSYISGYKGSVAIISNSITVSKSGCATATNNIDCSIHYSGIVFENAVMKAGNEQMPTHDNSSTMTGNEGDGYAVIYDTYHFEKEFSYSKETEVYAYTGAQKVYIAPKNGTYKVEVWGAQGGTNNDSYRGGYGGYSIGYVNLSKNDKLYINVGEKGRSTSIEEDSNFTYNGGGRAGSSGGSGSGGGATSVTLKSGVLSMFESSKSDVLIVAGGGGGYAVYNCSSSIGANGGGMTGTSEYGGTQIAGGTSVTQQNGKFGIGAYNDNTYWSTPGAGGGFYGGGTVANGCVAGGGSGYIGNSRLTNKEMFCYECTESSENDTKTTSVSCAEEDPTSECAKKGHGYARISLVN